MFRNLTHTSAVFLVITSAIILLSYNLRPKEHLNLFTFLLQRFCERRTPPRQMSTSENIEPGGATAQWLQNRFTSLYESVPPPPEEEYNMTALVYSAFGKNAEIFLNHKRITLKRFQEELEASNFGVVGSTIEWKELMEIPPKEHDPDSEGSIVAGVFILTRASKFLIRASPAIRLNCNIFSAKIEPDKAAQPDTDGSQHRITQLFITSVHRATPVHLQEISELAA